MIITIHIEYFPLECACRINMYSPRRKVRPYRGCQGAGGGAGCKVWHTSMTEHVFVRLSMFWSNPLHQNWFLREIIFIRVIPGWFCWKDFSTLSCNFLGTSNLIPRIRNLHFCPISFCQFRYGFRASGPCVSTPICA